MLKLEQVRAEMLERFERVDRRFAQHEQRVGRVDQRVSEIADRLEAMRLEFLDRLEALALAVRDLQFEGLDDAEGVPLPWPAEEGITGR